MGGKISRSRLEKLVENLSRDIDFASKSLESTVMQGIKRPVSSVLTSNKSVTAAESGTVFPVSVGSAFNIALPTPEVGLYYSFVCVADTGTGDVSVVATSDGSTEANLILVNLNEAALGPVFTASQSKLTFDASEGGNIGSALHFWCIGTSNPAWYCEAYTSVANQLDTGTA